MGVDRVVVAEKLGAGWPEAWGNGGGMPEPRWREDRMGG